MTEVPKTTPNAPVLVQPISTLSARPTTLPIPTPVSSQESSSQMPESKKYDNNSAKSTFTLPKLRLEIRELNHAGAEAFLSSVIASKALATSVQNVLSLLYVSPTSRTTTVPPTRSVTLILRSMGGVAYTVGSELDSDHKEIHFSVDYIYNSIASSRKTHEDHGSPDP